MRSGSVQVGRHLVYVSDEELLSLRRARGTETDTAAALAAALPEDDAALAYAEAALVDAKELTDRAEIGAELGGLLSGSPDPTALAERADDLLALARRRHGEGRYRDVLRITILLVNVFLLAQRWRALVETLELAHSAASALGDLAAEAWALHGLEVLATAAGKVELATALAERLGELAPDVGAYVVQDLAPAPGTAAPTGAQAPAAGKVAAYAAAHKVMLAGVIGLAAVAPSFAIGDGWYGIGGGGDAEIVAFAASRTSLDPAAVPSGNRSAASGALPGGTIRACRPLYLVSFVRVEGLEQGTSWSSASFVNGRPFATFSETWSDDSARTETIHSYHGPPGGTSNGTPVPAGRWRRTVSIEGEQVDSAEVTLVTNAC